MLKTCPECSKEISSDVKKCPHCGKDFRNWFMRHKVITYIGAFVVLVIFVNAANGNKGNTNTTTSTIVNTASTPVASPSEKLIETKATQYALKDGELGEFGKSVQIDGKPYIHYYVPVGKYSVEFLDTSTAKGGTLFVDKDETRKNSDGYTESINVIQLDFLRGDGKTKEMSVNKGEHVFITVNSCFRLTKMD